jgi:hypothetical protein
MGGLMASKHRIAGLLPVLVMPALVIFAGLAMQGSALLNHDVAWFAWGAREWLRGAVIGRDIVDPNFPLAFLIYLPAAVFAGPLGLGLAVKAWLLLVVAAIMVLAWQDVASTRRTAVFGTLAVFVIAALPREFAQRDQFAMLLVFPYVVPAVRHGWRAIVIGILAGIGFAIKPHFLIVWLLLEFNRRLFRAEQMALVCTGAIYALSLATIFPEFTFGLLPSTLEFYGAFNRADSAAHVLLYAVLPIVFGSLTLWLAVRERDDLAKSLALAALGFAIAGALQMKFYAYHLLPAWGFAAVAAAALVSSRDKSIHMFAIVLLVCTAVLQARPALAWWSDVEQREVMQPQLSAALLGARTFTVIAVHPYPAFPTAVSVEEESGIRYIGSANSHWFLPAAATGDARAIQLARHHAMQDIMKHPDIVLVDTRWTRHTNLPSTFDGLAFLLRDVPFARQWSAYRETGVVGRFLVFRRYRQVSEPSTDEPDAGALTSR